MKREVSQCVIRTPHPAHTRPVPGPAGFSQLVECPGISEPPVTGPQTTKSDKPMNHWREAELLMMEALTEKDHHAAQILIRAAQVMATLAAATHTTEEQR